MTLSVGSIVSVAIAGGITGNGVLCAAGCHFDIIGETPKAWKVQAETERGKEITAWLPKKALIKPVERGMFGNQPTFSAQFAHWFRPEGWTADFLRLATRTSTLAA